MIGIHLVRARTALALALLALALFGIGSLCAGATSVAAESPAPGHPPASGATAPFRGVVNINTASSELLQQLPGIGPARARAILEHRRTVGHFRSVEDLIEVRGIGPRALERLRPLCTVSGLSTARPR